MGGLAHPDESQFTRLFVASEPEVLRYIMATIPSPTDARDVLQETAVALWKKRAEYDPSVPFIPWACRFASLEIRGFLRRRQRQRRCLDDDVVALLHEEQVRRREQALAGEPDATVALRECLERLPATHHDVLRALGVIAAGILTAFTRLRGTWFGRIALPIAVLLYLGFGAGALVSQAQVWGWAQAGVPRAAVVLVALAVAAVVLPATTRRNVYCSHLCAHGAAQQLLVRFAKPKRTVPARLRPWLGLLPWALLALAILTAVLHLPVSLVDMEPFDGYLPTVAGLAALVLFVVSLVASGFYPMAYCRHACPTGALLDHLRLHGRSGRLTWRDGIMVACVVAAVAAHWWPR